MAHPALALALASVLWQTSADLDGDGKPEEIVLRSSDLTPLPGRDPRFNVAFTPCANEETRCRLELSVGAAKKTFTVKNELAESIGLRVVDLGRRKALLLQQSENDVEDPPILISVVLWDGGRLRIQELGYSSEEPSVDGKGSIRLRHVSCPDELTVSYALTGARLVRTARKRKRTRSPDSCAACPAVYLLEGGRFGYRGEILRNLRRADLAGPQELSLGAAQPVVTIELREEKDEVTFLDDVHLEVGGMRLPPRECATPQPFCAPDGAVHTLRRGDRLRLSFAVPDAGGPMRLHATGYYLPTP